MCWLAGWLPGWLPGWPHGWLPGWLPRCLAAWSLPVRLPVSACLPNSMPSWLVDCLLARAGTRSVGRSVGRPVGRSVGASDRDTVNNQNFKHETSFLQVGPWIRIEIRIFIGKFVDKPLGRCAIDVLHMPPAVVQNNDRLTRPTVPFARSSLQARSVLDG